MKQNKFILLYYIAVDFLELNYSQKLNIGRDLKLVTDAHNFIQEEPLEKLIFKKMYPYKLQDFIKLVYDIKYEFK